MLLMVITSQPLKSTVEVGKVFAASLASPMSHVNTVGMWLAYGGEGVITYLVVELEKGFEDEGNKEIANILVKYYDIEGYKAQIIPVLKPEEALSMIGMAPPA